MPIAYLVNQYPKVSHSFIRREIQELETQGVSVARFSIRSKESELVDPSDQEELKKTRFVLTVGGVGLLKHLLRVALTRPNSFIKTLALTLKIGLNSDRGILRHLAYLAEACVLLHWFTESKITHVHAHFGTNSTTVAMLCQALGGPTYSFTVHGPEEFDKAYLIALDEKIKRASFVVAISSFGRSQLFRWCDRDYWPKIHLIHCGLDASYLQATLTPIPDVNRLVCVGRLGEQKGHLLLVLAVSQLVAEGEKFQLFLVGDGPLRTELENLITALNLQDHIIITGWANSTEVQQQIIAAKALVLPSFAEGLPVVIMEAMALGRPVISTYIAGIPELVQPGISGWLVPAGSLEDLVLAMRAALTTPVPRLAEMGQIAAKRVKENHDISIETGKLVQLFNKLS